MSAAGSFLIIAVNGFSVASFARLRASRMQLSSMRCCLASEFFVSVIFNDTNAGLGEWVDRYTVKLCLTERRVARADERQAAG